MTDEETEKQVHRLALGLCDAFSVDPGAHIRAGDEPKFAAYAGDTYYQWARDQVEIVMTIVGLSVK